MSDLLRDAANQINLLQIIVRSSADKLAYSSEAIENVLNDAGGVKGRLLEQAIAEAEKVEPVAWVNQDGGVEWDGYFSVFDYAGGVPLYTTPPAPKRLTDAEIESISDDFTDVSYGGGESVEYFDRVGFARAIEAKLQE